MKTTRKSQRLAAHNRGILAFLHGTRRKEPRRASQTPRPPPSAPAGLAPRRRWRVAVAENSKIEWTDHTFNPWLGCTKISPACDHCYAEGWAKRTGSPELWNGQRRRTSTAYWGQPIVWNRKAMGRERRKVFCASLADVFDNQAPDEWRRDLFKLIRDCTHLDWLLLTKRPQNAWGTIQDAIGAFDQNMPWPWPHVWIGTTVENQAEADRRIPHLLAVPAKKRFLSCEPLLGPVDLTKIEMLGGDATLDAINPVSDADLWRDQWDPNVTGTTLEDAIEGFRDFGGTYPPSDKPHPTINWVIAGGESGSGARPMHLDWARSLRDQCQAAGVPFFFKQMMKKAPIPDEFMVREFPQ